MITNPRTDEDFEELARQREAERVRRERHDLEARIPVRFRTAEVDNPKVREWISSETSLLMVGPTGVGKTHQAFGIIRELDRQAWEFITAADLFASLRPRQGYDTEALMQRYCRTGLLVIDDLGASKPTDWTDEITFRLINTRYENLRRTVITSNLPVPELKKVIGERVSSRLTEMCTVIAMKGEDRRLSLRPVVAA